MSFAKEEVRTADVETAQLTGPVRAVLKEYKVDIQKSDSAVELSVCGATYEYKRCRYPHSEKQFTR